MGVRVAETLLGAEDVSLQNLQGAEIFAGQGRHAGLEL